MADEIDETIVAESGACLRHQAAHLHEWWVIHVDNDEYGGTYFDSATKVRRFLVAALAALDEWEARRQLKKEVCREQ